MAKKIAPIISRRSIKRRKTHQELRAEIDRLRDALAPFSWYYSVNDCAETDQKNMEVPVSALRRAFEAHPVTAPPSAC